MLISSSSRYSIYKVQFAASALGFGNFAILTQPVELVKNFFQLLSSFFDSVRLLPPTVADSLHILAYAAPFVKWFFTIFQILFCANCYNPVRRKAPPDPARIRGLFV